MCTSTERAGRPSAWRAPGWLTPIASALVLAHAAAALAHEPTPAATRELVRLQGYRSSAPSGVRIAREVTLVVFGEEHRFHATEWQRFAFAGAGAGETAEPGRLALQGDRATLAKFANARSDQRLTILAERRPGGADLFVVALDLCPPQ